MRGNKHTSSFSSIVITKGCVANDRKVKSCLYAFGQRLGWFCYLFLKARYRTVVYGVYMCDPYQKRNRDQDKRRKERERKKHAILRSIETSFCIKNECVQQNIDFNSIAEILWTRNADWNKIVPHVRFGANRATSEYNNDT